MPYRAAGRFAGSRLSDLDEDPAEDRELCCSAAELRLEEHLREALRAVEALGDQLEQPGPR